MSAKMSAANRVFGTTDDGSVEFVLYKPEHLEGFKNVLWNGYLQGECLANGVGLNLPENVQAREDISKFCEGAFTDGISIMALDVETKKVVGHVINVLLIKDPPGTPSPFATFMNDVCKSPVSKEYTRVIIEMDAKVDMFAANSTDVLMELIYLGVDPAYTRRSIGFKLVEFTLQLARELKSGKNNDLLPVEKREASRRVGGVTALYASNYSKAIGDRLGFVNHLEVFYEEMEFQGKRLQERIPNPLQRSMKLVSVPI